MILGRWVSFSCGDTSMANVSDRRYSEFCGFSSSTTCLLLRTSASLRCSCLKSKSPPQEIEQLETEEGFSVLASEIPWEEKNIWSTFALYIFSLHIPLSFGGLSTVANILHQRILDPQTQVLSLVFLQIVELAGTVLLLRTTSKPQCKSINFLKGNDNSREGRNWLVGSALGLGCLVGFVFVTSLVADQLIDSKAVHESELGKIMMSGDESKSGCIVLYCVLAPILEEIVYRRFLLTSLASRMEWWKAVIISSGVFAAAHFSGEDFVQLYGIGCVLGSCYSWSGNLASSMLVHSLYNALTLLLSLRQ